MTTTTKKSSVPRRTRTAKAPEAPLAAPKESAPAKRVAKRKAAPGLQANIDYPQEGEIVRPGHYSIRIATTPMAVSAEISLDGGAWMACREAAGFWWYDWSGFEPGPHSLTVRAQGESPVPATAERFVTVAAETEATAE